MALVYSWILFGFIICPGAEQTWSEWYYEVMINLTYKLWMGMMLFATPWMVYSLCCDVGRVISMYACAPLFVFPFVLGMGMVVEWAEGIGKMDEWFLAKVIPMAMCGTILLFYFGTKELHENRRKFKEVDKKKKKEEKEEGASSSCLEEEKEKEE